MADPVETTGIRLGRVERAILAALPRDGGFVSRDTVVRVAYPGVKPQPAVARLDATAPPRVCEGRDLAEAAVSRAIGSLQRKGLVVRDRNRVTGRTLLRSSTAINDPSWELVARTEEHFSAHAAAMARQWRSLSVRARERAARLRVDRSADGTEDERRVDMALGVFSEAHAITESLRVSSNGVPQSRSRRQWWRSLRIGIRTVVSGQSGANGSGGGPCKPDEM